MQPSWACDGFLFYMSHSYINPCSSFSFINDFRESNSLPGRIHCSDRAAALLKGQAPNLPILRRGVISVKGKGDMETWWVAEVADESEINMPK